MSCETQARLFGVQLVRRDKTSKRTESGKPVRLFVFEKRLPTRRTLHVEWHTKAGAWEAALRWAKKMSRGEL